MEIDMTLNARKSAEWYFDFISPFAYLQLEMMARISALADVTLTPVVLGGVLKARGQLGPAEIPHKRLFTYRFVQWSAQRHGIPLKWPPAHPFNPIKALRLSIALRNDPTVVRTIFRHLWCEGRSLEDIGDWQSLCEQVDATEADQRIGSPEVKAALKTNSDRAIAAGVFGVPTFIIDGEIFWGVDATDMVVDYLENPRILREGEFARLAALPVGASRT
jgi:2-hydroxychromene-2-carboxylate isomerase